MTTLLLALTWTLRVLFCAFLLGAGLTLAWCLFCVALRGWVEWCEGSKRSTR